jgi:hypothetical protein
MAEVDFEEFDGAIPEKILDADYVLQPREVAEIDKTVYDIVWQNTILQKIFPTIQIKKGMKTHKFIKVSEPHPPVFTEDFMKEDYEKIRSSETTVYVCYMHKDFQIPKVTIDASRSQKYYNRDILTLHISVMVQTLVSYKERVLFRGFDIGGRRSSGSFSAIERGSINDNVKGLMNMSGTQSFEAGADANDELGSAGDIPYSIVSGAEDLIDYEGFGPYDVILSPKAYAQALKNRNSTTHETDLERALSLVDMNKQAIVRKIWVSAFLENATDDGTNSAIVVLQRKTPNGHPTCVIGEEYPVRHYPTTQNQFGVRGKVIWAGTLIPIYPEYITIASDIDVDGTT